MARRSSNQPSGPLNFSKILRGIFAVVVALGVYAYRLWTKGGREESTASRQSDTRSPTGSNGSNEPVTNRDTAPRQKGARATTKQSAGDVVLLRAIRDKRSDVIVESEGVVTRVLADDIEGDRHQRFILRLSGGETILIAHNIDVAQRVPVAEDDRVAFKGEFEWNEQGGCVHWTHHDSGRRHPDGWLKVADQKFD